ncbi:MAG: response regulator [Treponema sp.]|nr:response regulator [Treponema sp.]
MSIEREKYVPMYVQEGLEVLGLAENLLFDIRDGISLADDISGMLRVLHTLKGSSRMLGFACTEELCHGLEEVFVALREGRIGLGADAVNLVISALDLLKRTLGIIAESGDDGVDTGPHLKALLALVRNEEFSVPDSPSGRPEPTAALPETVPGEPGDSGERKTREDKAESIRVSVDKIDGIIRNIASLQSLEIRAKNLHTEGLGLGEALDEFFRQMKSEAGLRPELRKSLTDLRLAGERLQAGLKIHAVEVGSGIHDAYGSVISLRTVPLFTILDGFPRYVHDLSLQLGKRARLVVEGGNNEIDKNIIEMLSPILMHMLRNAVDHGIECPEKRLDLGKEEAGTVRIACSQESGAMRILVTDDGKGIDHLKVRERIVADGLADRETADGLSPQELYAFIFRGGFSTSGSENMVSGRGIGMDVVLRGIEQIKGSITVESSPGEGTTFTITVPLSVAALVGFPVRAGGMRFIIPAAFVETVLPVMPDHIVTIIDRPEIRHAGRLVKFHHLSQLLDLKSAAAPSADRPVLTLVVRSFDDVIALAVDDMSGMRQVILKPMPAFLETIPVFSGLVLDEDYRIVSVLHVPTLVKMAKRIKAIDIMRHSLELEKLRLSVLVVDDSPATREIEREILTSEGYLADTAGDGSEALRAARNRNYDLIITDLNMPVMDGFTLLENLKKNPEFAAIPVIVVSSLTDEDSRKRSLSLGAADYIMKKSFNNDNLLRAIRSLIGTDNGR